MKRRLKSAVKALCHTPLAPIIGWLLTVGALLRYRAVVLACRFHGDRLPTKEQAALVTEQVTFIFKSFERQSMAKRLYRNIQRYYPGARVIIADDSRKPLKLKGASLQIVQLPFNQGLSVGLNRALAKVQTPFTMRLDDDMLLTPRSNIHDQLRFLTEHEEIDLVGIQASVSSKEEAVKRAAKKYAAFSMKDAPRPLLVPHCTRVDRTHVVVGKTANIFLVRTEKYRALGYDDRIRMIDHHEFFLRAAGVLVSAVDIRSFVYHYHNRADTRYTEFRSDIDSDLRYIKEKHNL